MTSPGYLVNHTIVISGADSPSANNSTSVQNALSNSGFWVLAGRDGESMTTCDRVQI